jgi:hypothetical protein
MVPVLCLDIEPHHAVLDMCASPGSKTSQVTFSQRYLPPSSLPHKKFHCLFEGLVIFSGFLQSLKVIN